jgi:hypothetical protein
MFLVALLSAYECYLKNTVRSRFGAREAELTNLCICLDEIDWRVTSLQQYCSAWDWRDDLSDVEVEGRDNLLQDVARLRNDLMSLEELARLPKLLDDDEFFEELAEKTKSAVLGLQLSSIKLESLEKRY